MNPQDQSYYNCPYCGKPLYWKWNKQEGDEAYYCPNCQDWYDDYEIEPDKDDFDNLEEEYVFVDLDDENSVIDLPNLRWKLRQEEKTKEKLKKCPECGFYERACQCSELTQKTFLQNLRTKLYYKVSLFLKKMSNVFFWIGSKIANGYKYFHEKALEDRSFTDNLLQKKATKNNTKYHIKNGGML